MQKPVLLLAAALCLAQAPRCVQAQDENDALRRRIDAMQRSIDELGRKAGASENSANPDLSLILNARYASLAQDPRTYALDGFLPSGGGAGPGRRGAGLDESELVLSGNIDPFFSGTFVASLAPDGGASVENAYVQSTALAQGFVLRAGRFFSKIGYQNEQHAHTKDFIDTPLPYRAFLGGQLGDDGLQLKWTAPTELFFELGGEAGRGRAFPASDREKNGIALGTLFAHLGGDLGASHSWRAGVSLVGTSPQDRRYDDFDSAGNPVTNSFSGRSRLRVADFVWKWAPEGNTRYRSFKFQAEYFQRSEEGVLVFDATGLALPGAYASRQSGAYAQAVYQFAPAWRAGLRLDRLDYGTQNVGLAAGPVYGMADFPVLQAHDARLRTAMLDWSPSEFSRLRLQLARDESRMGAPDRQIFLQLILSMGAHGAHAW